LLGGEVAAETRWQPDDGKEWGGHLRASELFGFPSAGERVVAAAEAGEGGEGAVVALVILEAGPGHRGALGATLVFGDGKELLLIRVRQRAEKNGSDEGEDGGVRADAEREGEE